jgi:uncharacterized protein
VEKQMSPSLNPAGLAAIDVHVYAEVSSSGAGSLPPELEQASGSYFKIGEARRPTLPEIAAYYRERRMACVVFTVDAQSATGQPPVPNEEIAEAAAAHPDVIIPFGLRATRRSRSWACPRSSTPARPASAPGHRAGAGSG